MQTIEISKMSVAQRLQIMEDLWDSLRAEEEINPPNWHEEVLAARIKKIQSGKTTFITLDTLKRKNEYKKHSCIIRSRK